MLKKFLVYLALAAAAFLLQNNVFSACPLISTVPNLLLIVTCTVGFSAGAMDGMLAGLICGVMLDAFFGGVIGFYALIYMAVGYVNGVLGTVLYRDFFGGPVLLNIGSDLLYGLYVFIFSFLLRGRTALGAYFIKIMLPEVIYTALVAMLVYRPLLRAVQAAEAMSKRSAKRFV